MASQARPPYGRRMLQSYLPVLVFAGLGLVVGTAFVLLNSFVGARSRPGRAQRVRREPYECGLPSEFSRTFRYGFPFYMTAMLFMIFDIEIVLLFAVAPLLPTTGSVYVLVAILIFIFLLAVGFVYDWAKGGLEWQ